MRGAQARSGLGVRLAPAPHRLAGPAVMSMALGQSDPQTTWKHYLRLFDRTEVEKRIREAQASLD
jgi:hypothetical protein